MEHNAYLFTSINNVFKRYGIVISAIRSPQLGRYLIGGVMLVIITDCECSVSWLEWFVCVRTSNFYDSDGMNN